MGSIGTLGGVNAEFTASTSNFSAAITDMDAKLAALAAKATAAGQKTDAGIRLMETAAERARKAWQRELLVQDRAADAAAEVARASELAALKADILSRANDKLALSSNHVVAAFQRMSRGVSTSLDTVGEKMTAVAEKAELSADGIAAGFGGLGKILGVGLAGDFLAHTLDNMAELNVKLGDLHEKTGIAVQDLAGLRMLAQSKGLDFTTISMGLIRMAKAMYEAKQGMQEDMEAFSSLGISMKEVNTLSPEQMLYRLSKALGENRSLVVADGTALEIFGRGGKEMVPMLREFGSGLRDMAKQQGALTGITNESVASSQQWLRATVDLSTEFHSALIPVLEDLVKALPYVTAGFNLLEVGVEKVFGTIINGAVTVVESILDIGRAVSDAATLQPSAALKDLKNIWTANSAGWQAEKAYEDAHALAATRAIAMIGNGLLPGHENSGVNQPGDADGALMKSGKQRLAAMEQNHPLSHTQIIAFWKKELAQAKPGSVDYQQVNLLLGNLMEHAGLKRHAGSQKTQHANVGAMEKAAAEMKRLTESTAKYHQSTQTIAGKMSSTQLGPYSLWWGGKENGLGEVSSTASRSRTELESSAKETVRQLKKMLSDSRVALERWQATPRGAAVAASSDYFSQFSGANIAGGLTGGTLDTVNGHLSQLASTGHGNFSGMFRGLGGMAATQGIGGLENKFLKGPLEKLLGGKGALGATASNAMWVRIASTSALAASLPGSGMTTRISSLTDLIPGISQSGGMAGSGGSKGAAGVLNGLAGMATSFIPGGSFLTKLFSHLPHFAAGGFISTGLPSIVGENGPELFVPHASGRIVPNHELGGGGQTIHVDARGATDPAATAIAVHRAIRAAHDSAVKQSMHASHEMKARTPRG